MRFHVFAARIHSAPHAGAFVPGVVFFTCLLASLFVRADDTLGSNVQANNGTQSAVEGFRSLGPPTLEQLDKLFPKSSKEHPSKTARQKVRPPKNNENASDLLMQMLQSADPAIRVRAVEGLTGGSAKDSVPLILIALADSEADVRSAASRALALVPDDALMDSIVGALGWGDPAVAQAVDAALPNLRNVIETPLLARFESPETPRVERMAAAYCLGRIGSNRAGTPLTNEIWGNDLTLALYCANALVTIEDPGLLRQYIRMASHPQVEMRVTAYRGLARIGGDDARRILLPAAKGATEPDSAARKVAIRYLANTPNDEVVEYLMALVRADAGFVRPASDALAAMFGLPQGMHRGLWLDWYKDYYAPAKQAGKQPDSARANTNPGADVPVGFPEGGFPFIP
jgi:hypothetical protein